MHVFFCNVFVWQWKKNETRQRSWTEGNSCLKGTTWMLFKPRLYLESSQPAARVEPFNSLMWTKVAGKQKSVYLEHLLCLQSDSFSESVWLLQSQSPQSHLGPTMLLRHRETNTQRSVRSEMTVFLETPAALRKTQINTTASVSCRGGRKKVFWHQGEAVKIL